MLMFKLVSTLMLGMIATAAAAVTPGIVGPATVQGAVNVNFGPLQQYGAFGTYAIGTTTFDVGATPTPYIRITKTAGDAIYSYNTLTYDYQVGLAAVNNPIASIAGLITVTGSTLVQNDSAVPTSNPFGYYQLSVTSNVPGSDREYQDGYSVANGIGLFNFNVGGVYLGSANGQDLYGGTLKLFIYTNLSSNSSGTVAIDPTLTLNAAQLTADGFHGPANLALSPGIGGNGGNIILSGAVPEPATWVMWIAGFGLIGGMVRRRSRAVLG